MKPLRKYWAHAALVGLSLAWTGCGGSDPSTDASAAPDEAAPSPVAAAGGGEAAAPESTPAEPAAASEPAAPGGAAQAPAAEEVTAVEPAATPVPGAGATKGDSSGTSELLALANSTPSGEEPAATDAAPSAQPGPGGPGGAGGRGFNMGPGAPGMNPPGAPGAASGAPPGFAMPTPPGGVPGGAGAYPAGANFPGAPGGAGMPGPGGPGGRGMPGGPGGAMGPGEGSFGGGAAASGPFALQIKAATDFLSAVKARDKDRLAESVALRSPQEASSERNKKLFAAILEQNITDTELDDIAKSLEGYQVTGYNDAKSSGRLGIILSKTEDGDTFRRTVTVRKEAKGWKVLDVGGVGKIDGFSRIRTPSKTKGSR